MADDMVTVVPWMSSEEWKMVHRLIYSQDILKMEDGYWIMRGWKCRCPKLPAGVECTIIIVEALLIEHQMQHVTALESHNILTSCYAMALTRFLNLASSFGKEKTWFSMYRIARHLDLPEWIVNVRHRSAHGLELPSIVVMKAGLKLALEWLDKQYWRRESSRNKCELEEAVSTMKFKKRFSDLVNAYEHIMTSELLSNEISEEAKSANIDFIMKNFVDHDDDWMLEYGLDEEVVKDIPTTVKECTAVIMRKLMAVLKSAEMYSVQISSLLDHFLWESNFLPDSDPLDLYTDSLSKNALPWEMISFWKSFLEEVVQKAGILGAFTRKLLNFKSKEKLSQRWAAIWVKYLAICMKSAVTSGREKKNTKNMKGVPRKSNVMPTKKKDHNEMCTLNFMAYHLPAKAELNDIVERVIFNPGRSSLVYIRELLELYEEPLPPFKKAMIVKTIEIQLQVDEVSFSEEAKDCSTDMSQIEEFLEHISPQRSTRNAHPRTASNGESSSFCEWENLPLGMYPRSHQQTASELPKQECDEDVIYFSD